MRGQERGPRAPESRDDDDVEKKERCSDARRLDRRGPQDADHECDRHCSAQVSAPTHFLIIGRVRLMPRFATNSLRTRVPLRLLKNLHARAGAHACRARCDHRLQTFEIADAARSLDAHFCADGAPHQRDVRGRRAAGPEAGRRLDVIGAGRFGQRAGGDLLFVRE